MQNPDPERLRKRGRVVVVVIILAILTGGVLGSYKINRYSPLEMGAAFGAPEGSVCRSGPESGEERTVCQVPYAHGREASFAFTVRNGGFWGVTIVDLPILRETGHQLLRVRRVTIGDSDDPDAVAAPFRPFALRSGDERLITLHGVFSDCEWYAADSGNAYDAIAVRYRFAWATREAWIPLPSRVHVISPTDAECPVERAPTVRTSPGAPNSRATAPTGSP